MTIAYSQNAAYDYRRFEEPEQSGNPEEAIEAARPINRRGIALRRTLVLVTAVAAAAVCIGLLSMKAQVFKAQREVNDVNMKISEARKLNDDLTQRLNEAMNVNTIMEKAGKLGMKYPSGSQMLYVSLDGNGTSVEMKK